MRTLSLLIVIAFQTIVLAGDPIIVDHGTPERAPGDGERMVVEVGAPSATSPEHQFVVHLAHSLDATEVMDGSFDIDRLVADIADPARKNGPRKKIATLIFAGHMTYVAPHGNDIVKDANGVPYGYLTVGKATYASELHAHFVAKLEAALRANGLTFSAVFAPQAVIEFKVCNGAKDAKDLMEGLARDLPRGMRVKAYDEGYVWQSGDHDFLWLHDRPYFWGILGQWFGERPKLRFNLGDQKNALVVFEGSNDGLDAAPPTCTRAPAAASAPDDPATLRTAPLAGAPSDTSCGPPARTRGVVGALR